MAQPERLGLHLSLPFGIVEKMPEIDLFRLRANAPTESVLNRQIELELMRRRHSDEAQHLFPGMSSFITNGYGQD